MESDLESSHANGVQVLADTLMKHHVPRLLVAENSLNELTAKQDMLAVQLSKQNSVLNQAVKGMKVDEMVAQTKLYQAKLLTILKSMEDLNERVQKIKKRALKLEQQKQHDALLKEQSRDRELEREKQLIARPAKRN